MTDDLPMMVHIVEKFIHEKKGVRIKIVFDDPMKIRMHTKMLGKAFDIALAYYNYQI
jgi:hypothetical protein